MRHKPRTRSRVMAADQGVDIVGDVHACYDEFMELLQRLGYERCHDGTHRHPEGRKLLSLGDITSRGPQSIKMLQFFIRHVAAGLAEMVDSNHGWKIARWLDGRPVMLAHGDEKVADEFQIFEREYGARRADQLKEQSRRLLFSSPSHMMVHYQGRLVLVAVHAGIRDDYIGKESPSIQSYCRYGDVAGTGADGRPIRRDWAAERVKAEPLIVWGHDPRPEPERKNGTLNIDQGCVFGGMLTAYRFPEDEIVSVPARENYSGLAETPLTRYLAEFG
ncbi:metallophosphoesterase [Brevibacillus borstelensis]|uniref:metallophosphoesterase n=1 Tax=Brevibacillus TaxID=55080 RepID=UPI001562B5CD|nr:metallophosphoesterase [Brevibacillus borstelensis]MBE5396556.1 metallophosphoesterase [Brevibacillus borstelensis]WNF04840.1 metallophosphoesterase [Brevibacillus borstelensis]